MPPLAYRHSWNALLALLASLGILAWGADQTSLETAVVKITAKEGGRSKTGSGFIVHVTPEIIYIVTASHVIEGSEEPLVEFHTRRDRPIKASVKLAERNDPKGLALLIVTGKDNIPAGLSTLALDAGSAMRGGDEVMAIGFPRMGGDWAVSKGHFSARQGRELIFAMPVGEGNSGGPLVKDGKVVALVTSEGQGKAFAVAAASVGLFLDGSGIEINRGGTDQSIRIADKIPSPAGASNFKGEWRGLHPGFDPRFNLSGSTGILTYSPDQKFQKGIEVLRVRSVSGNTFSGEVMCSDGKFYEVKGTLRADGKLFLAVEPGSGCGDSLWERYVAPAAEPAIVHDSKNQAGQVTDLLEGKDGSTTATGPRQGATGAGPSVSARDDCALPVEREGLSGIDAAMGLGATTEYARYQAIYSMARGKQLRIPLCAGESATILRGTTGNNRALAIAEIALVVKIDLSGDEAALILGTTQESNEYARYQAIYSLAQAKKFKVGLGGEDAKRVLDGTTGNNRALAIAELALVVKSELSGDEAALILGSVQESNEYARYQGIYSLARAKKFKARLGGADLQRILDGTSGNNRVLAVSELSQAR